MPGRADGEVVLVDRDDQDNATVREATAPSSGGSAHGED
jgi:hypothetical protein